MQVRPTRQRMDGSHTHHPDDLSVSEGCNEFVARIRLPASPLQKFPLLQRSELRDNGIRVPPFSWG